MKKMTKVAFVLASAITLGSLVSCGQPTESALEQITSVTEFKVKAYPGMNVLTWKPSEVTNGYVIFRQINGGNYECLNNNVSVNGTYFTDTISLNNEWQTGDEIKYLIQNKGQSNFGRSVLSKIVADSSFVEASVKGINPGYREEVVYKVPALEEGKSVPNFVDFDYSNAEEVAKLVEPTATIKSIEDSNELYVSFVNIPYLYEKLYVTNEDGSEKMEFSFIGSGTAADEPDVSAFVNVSGNAKLITPFYGKNNIWVELSQSDYLKSKKLLLGSVDAKYNGSCDLDYESVSISWDSENQVYVISWNIPTDENGAYVKDCKFYLYHAADWYVWQKVEITPELNEFTGKYEATLPNGKFAAEGRYRFFAANAEGENLVHYDNAGNPFTYKELVEGGHKDHFWNGLNPQIAVSNISTDDNGNETSRKISLVWNPVMLDGEVAKDVTYKVYKEERDAVDTEKWSDPVEFSVTLKTYDENVEKVVTNAFTAPSVDTKYTVKAFYKDHFLFSSDVTFWDNASYSWGYVYNGVRDGKKVTYDIISAKNDEKPVENKYVVYYQKYSYNYEDVLDLSVATKVTPTVQFEKLVEGNKTTVGTLTFDLPDDTNSYKVWIYEVNGDISYNQVLANIF